MSYDKRQTLNSITGTHFTPSQIKVYNALFKKLRQIASASWSDLILIPSLQNAFSKALAAAMEYFLQKIEL
jgi:Na+-transporting methylmalonyl-CoA/oxaloacetate decarboxylase beta subunit